MSTRPFAECPVERALHAVGGRWKLTLLWHLSGAEDLRWGELKRRVPAVSEKMLAESLRELVADGLVLRVSHEEVPPRVHYSLTDRGRALHTALHALAEWGLAHT